MSTRDPIAKIYGKPLVRDLDASPLRALEIAKRTILKKIREKLFQSTFSDRAKKAFAKAIKAEVSGSTLTIVANHPAFKVLLAGQAKKQMRWLLKAPTPIPIITETGELIFRTPTAHSMDNGGWVHPGHKKQSFIEKAKEEAKLQIREKVSAEIRKVLRAAGKGK